MKTIINPRAMLEYSLDTPPFWYTDARVMATNASRTAPDIMMAIHTPAPFTNDSRLIPVALKMDAPINIFLFEPSRSERRLSGSTTIMLAMLNTPNTPPALETGQPLPCRKSGT